jgi:fibronectin-binding autotransporter adhesin
MANRYLRAFGADVVWDATDTSIWAQVSGGATGFSVPTLADDVFIDANTLIASQLVIGSNAFCKSLTITNAGSFNFLFQFFTLEIQGNFVITSTTISFPDTGNINFTGTGSSLLTTNGLTLNQTISVNGRNLTLGGALNTSGNLQVVSGTFTSSNFNITTTGSLISTGSATRTINLGSSTVSVFIVSFSTDASFTFNAGTSNIIVVSSVAGGNKVFNNVSSLTGGFNISDSNTFNNLSFGARTSTGMNFIAISGNQTINGTLTILGGADPTRRTFMRSGNGVGQSVTLTCAAVALLTDIDFRDITIAGTAAPVSGTRLGNCGGNSGITFPAAKTVYWNLAGSNNWSSTAWATSAGGTPAVNNFPLAQDTAIFTATSPATGQITTVNFDYNIGTIDMSARTSNTMTLAIAIAPAIYGNWINGTGSAFSGTGRIIFSGQGAQTITSAGITFTQGFTVDCGSGSVSLQSAFATNRSLSNAFIVESGTFNTNNLSFTLSGASGGFNSTSGKTTALNIGSSTLFIARTWSTALPLAVSGTGSIRMTSASTKTFSGGGIQTFPTITQGGSGSLTISGSNKFANITNTAIGTVLFTGGTTNEFTAFNLNGTSTAIRLTLGSSNTTQAILRKSTAWLMGAGSLDGGNNTGLSFTAGGGIDFLSVSYINGTLVGPPSSTQGNFFAFF